MKVVGFHKSLNKKWAGFYGDRRIINANTVDPKDVASVAFDIDDTKYDEEGLAKFSRLRGLDPESKAYADVKKMPKAYSSLWMRPLADVLKKLNVEEVEVEESDVEAVEASPKKKRGRAADAKPE